MNDTSSPNQRSILSSLITTYQLLPPDLRPRAYLLSLGILVNSLLELFGLAAIVPLLAATLSDSAFQEGALATLYQVSGASGRNEFIFILCGFVLVAILAKHILGILIYAQQVRFVWDMYQSLCIRIVRSIFARGHSYISQQNSSTLHHEASVVPFGFSNILLVQQFNFLNELAVLTLITIALILFQPVVVLLLFAIVLPVFLGFYFLARKKLQSYQTQVTYLQPAINKNIFEMLLGFSDIVVNQAFGFFEKNLETKLATSKGLRLRLTVLQQLPQRLVDAAVVLSVILMLLYGVLVLQDTESTIALIAAFGLAAFRSIPALNRLIAATATIRSMSINFDLIEKHLPGESAEQNAAKRMNFVSKLRFDEVTYQYPDRSDLALDSIQLTINKGDVLGIVGESGSGKSTLVNVILGLLQPTSGRIIVDDTEITPDQAAGWQQVIGYVSQDTWLMDGSILDNIALGVSPDDMDNDRLKHALELSALDELIDSLDAGVHTKVGERGALLSGGQKQRVGIARSLYHDSEVIVLDEVTSALDQKTEQQIIESIGKLAEAGITLIVVAHRLSTLSRCNQIIQLESGVITWSGSYADLVGQSRS